MATKHEKLKMHPLAANENALNAQMQTQLANQLNTGSE